ncbi:hypothetical protein [Virgisporangium aurantiacum]|uniref:Uncharacterized protein n=1 Tax=Virgisporangium aurantiacum TaxID=175570 RepID=A0A8J3ZDM5_9ACTN|nr:hypothetical protein [Virgisporangium aurantiacum]GIJ62057.1 hypothetical protein Vau01_095730 [Virgisporangium aurantiacum]
MEFGFREVPRERRPDGIDKPRIDLPKRDTPFPVLARGVPDGELLPQATGEVPDEANSPAGFNLKEALGKATDHISLRIRQAEDARARPADMEWWEVSQLAKRHSLDQIESNRQAIEQAFAKSAPAEQSDFVEAAAALGRTCLLAFLGVPDLSLFDLPTGPLTSILYAATWTEVVHRPAVG